MKLIPTFQEFVDNFEKQENEKKAAQELKRFKELAGIEQSTFIMEFTLFR